MKQAMRKIAKEEVGKHVKAMHKGKGYKKGGPTSPDMMKRGRNMARAMNQTGKKA